MIGERDIDSVNPRDRYIRAKDFNKIIASVNKGNKTSFDPSSVVCHSEGSITSSTLVETYAPGDFPFRIEDVNGQKISVVIGNWIRDETIIPLSASSGATADPDDSTKLLIDISTGFLKDGVAAALEEDVDYYVYLELLVDPAPAGGVEFDPAIIPGILNVLVDQNVYRAGVMEPLDSYNLIKGIAPAPTITLRDFFIKTKVLIGIVQLEEGDPGNFFIKSIKQKLDDDVIDYQLVPDTAASDDSAASHYRSVIETNPILDEVYGGTVHYGELQLRGVGECPGQDSYTFPYFLSAETNNYLTGPSGTLQWMSPDTRYLPQGVIAKYHTLEARPDHDPSNVPDEDEVWSADNSFEIFTLHEVLDTYNYSKSVCYYDSDETETFQGIYDQTKGELKWASIDSHLDSSQVFSQDSLDVVESDIIVGENILQLSGFKSATTSTMATDDLILFRLAPAGGDGAKLKYADADDLWDYIVDFGGGGTHPVPVGDHTDLTDIIAGYYEHDHGNYWQNVDSTTGRIGAASWTYLVNNGSSIGDASKIKVIDMDYRQLTNGGDVYVDWDGMVLQNAGVTKVDWDNMQLTNGADIYVDWNNMLLQNAGVTTVDWNNMHLVDGPDSETVALDWATRQLENGVWTVTDATAAASGTGALVVTGGISTNQGLNVEQGAATYAGIFVSDAPRDFIVHLAKDDPSGYAGYFEDALNTLYACDGTYALLSSGDVAIDNGGGNYWHSGNEGWTGTFTNGDGDTVSVSGGIIYSVA